MQSELKIDDKVIVKGFETVAGGINAGHLQIRIGSGVVNHSQNKTVTFSTPFSNACYAVIVSCSNTTFAGTQTISASSWSKTGFTVWDYNSVNANNVGFEYIAIGY